MWANHISIGGFEIAFYGMIIGLAILAWNPDRGWPKLRRTTQNPETYFDLALYAVVVSDDRCAQTILRGIFLGYVQRRSEEHPEYSGRADWRFTEE